MSKLHAYRADAAIRVGGSISWKAGVSGNWATAADWSSGVVPGAADDVSIAASGTYVVTINSSVAAHSLSVTDSSATLAAGAGGTLSIGTTLALSAGTLALSNGGSIAGGTLNLGSAGTVLATGGAISAAVTGTGLIDVTSGTLVLKGGGALAGTLAGAGVLALEAGIFSSLGGTFGAGGNLVAGGQGTLAVAGGKNLTLSGPVSFGLATGGATLSGPGTFTTAGTSNINADGSVAALTLGGAAAWINNGTVSDAGVVAFNIFNGDAVSLMNGTGAHFNLTSDTANLLIAKTGFDDFTNAGTLAKTGGTATSTIAVALDNTGLIDVQTGTLAISNFSGSGSFALAAGATLLIEAGSDSAVDISGGSGTLALAGGTFAATTTQLAALHNLSMTGGTLSVTSNSSSFIAATTLSGPTSLSITSNAALNVSGPISLGGGSVLSLAGTGTTTLSGQVTLASGTVSLASGSALTVTGPMNFGPGSDNVVGPGKFVTEGITTVAAGIKLGNGIGWTNGGTVNYTGAGSVNQFVGDTVAIINQLGAQFNLVGTSARFSAAFRNGVDSFTNAGTLTMSAKGTGEIAMAVINSGMIDIKSGTLAVGNLSGTGQIVLNSGTTLRLENGTSSGTTISGQGGTLALTGGEFATQIGQVAGLASLLVSNGATLDFSGASGTLTPPLTLDTNATLRVEAGTDVTLNTNLVLTGTGASLAGPGTLTTNGTTMLPQEGSSETVTIYLTWVNGGTVYDIGGGVDDGGNIINEANASFILTTGNGSLQGISNPEAIFVNDGTLEKIGDPGNDTIGMQVQNSGQIDILAGTLGLGSLSGSGSVMMAAGTTLALYGGTLTSAISGTPGTLAVDRGTLTTSLGELNLFASVSIAGGVDLTDTSGTLTVPITNNNVLSIAAGADITFSGSISGNGGITLGSASDLTISGSLTSDSTPGFHFLDGLGTVTTAGNTSIAYSGDFFGLTDGVTWINQGIVSENDTIIFEASTGDTVTLINEVGASFILASNGLGLLNSSSGVSELINAGTLSATGSSYSRVIQVEMQNSGLIEAASGTLQLQSIITNTGTLQATAGGTLDLSIGNLTNFSANTLTGGSYEADTGSLLKLNANDIISTDQASIILSGAGSELTTLSGSASNLENVLSTIGAAGTLSLLNGRNYTVSANSGTFTDAGLLSLGGVAFAATALAISAGGTLAGSGSVAGGLTNAGAIVASGGGTLDLSPASVTNLSAAILTGGAYEADAGSVLQFAGTGILTDAASITLSGAGSGIHFYDVSSGTTTTLASQLSTIAAGGTLSLLAGRNYSVLTSTGGFTDAGLLKLSGAGFTATNLAISAGGTLSGSGSVSGTVVNTGSIIGTGGTLAFLGAVTNNNIIDASAGTISLASRLAGHGTMDIGGAATLALLNGAVTGQMVDFAPGAGLLDLTQATSFKGSIAGFGSANVIDLLGKGETGFTYSGSVLTITNGSATVAKLHFIGSYSQTSFAVGTDGHGGTMLTFL